MGVAHDFGTLWANACGVYDMTRNIWEQCDDFTIIQAAIIILQLYELISPDQRSGLNASPKAVSFGMTAGIMKCWRMIGHANPIPKAAKLVSIFVAQYCLGKI
jgi:hypothetical protein